MMKIIFLQRITLLIALFVFTSFNNSCNNDNKSISDNDNEMEYDSNLPPTIPLNRTGKTIKERITPPAGYTWITEKKGSFGAFLQDVKLEADGSPILDYTGQPISNQSEHVAILNYDVGNKNLQQCADAVIRLRAEYLLATQQEDAIGFHFTSGDYCKWLDYKNGMRPQVNGNSVSFVKTASADPSYANFRKYLDAVYNYAGTISVNRETTPVQSDADIHAGCILITPGSPGHAVMIVGEARNKKGDSIFILAESYMPAQSIHIVTNPFEKGINPWYHLSLDKSPTQTARYTFTTTNIRVF